MVIYLFSTASRSALRLAQLPVLGVPGALYPEAKRQGRESEHSPPATAEFKNAWIYTSISPIRLHGVVLS